jgi:hypothetical protein
MWAGIAMIVAVAVHLVLHWQWVRVMAGRVWRSLRSPNASVSSGARLNLWINIVIAAGFVLTAVSGVVLLFSPSGGYRGGTAVGWDPGFIFSRTTWDLVHTWSGIVLILAAVGHFIIHWKWITKVTGKVFRSPNLQAA